MGQETVTELVPASVSPFFVAVVRVMGTTVLSGAWIARVTGGVHVKLVSALFSVMVPESSPHCQVTVSVMPSAALVRETVISLPSVTAPAEIPEAMGMADRVMSLDPALMPIV